MSQDAESVNRNLIESLMSNKDPFLKQKLASYKQTLAKDKQPSFLFRMEKDSDVRKTISKVINQRFGVEDLKTVARFSLTSNAVDQVSDKAFEDVF